MSRPPNMPFFSVSVATSRPRPSSRPVTCAAMAWTRRTREGAPLVFEGALADAADAEGRGCSRARAGRRGAWRGCALTCSVRPTLADGRRRPTPDRKPGRWHISRGRRTSFMVQTCSTGSFTTRDAPSVSLTAI